MLALTFSTLLAPVAVAFVIVGARALIIVVCGGGASWTLSAVIDVVAARLPRLATVIAGFQTLIQAVVSLAECLPFFSSGIE